MATAELEIRPLEAGDRLTREEFMRIWEMNPNIKRAELIGGRVYMPSPVSIRHGGTEYDLAGWAFTYKVATPGVTGESNTTTYLLKDVAQPDVNLRILPECGGKSSRAKGDYLAGSAELLGEVCASSAAYDLHEKLDLYETAGVQEYLAVLVYEKEIRWHFLKKGKYERLLPGADGICRSGVFPGLWLDGQAFLNGDMRRVVACLQQGIGSPEHQAFVEELAKRQKARG
jgi:Uma2 family endonuclease